MKPWLGLLILSTGLVGCSSEEVERAAELTIEPKVLSEEEQALIRSTATDVYQAYELNGSAPAEADIRLEVEHYVNGELQGSIVDALFSIEEELDDVLVSFARSADIEGSAAFIGSGPSGKVMNFYETDEIGGSTFGGLLDDQTELPLEQPIYVGYYAVESENQMSVGEFFTVDNKLDLEAIEEFEHFYAMTVTITEEAP